MGHMREWASALINRAEVYDQYLAGCALEERLYPAALAVRQGNQRCAANLEQLCTGNFEVVDLTLD